MESEILITSMNSHCAIMKLHKLRDILKHWRLVIEFASEELTLSDKGALRRSISSTVNSSTSIDGVSRTSRSQSAATYRVSSSGGSASFHRHRSEMSSDSEISNSAPSAFDLEKTLPVFAWAYKYYLSLLSKFTLYFYQDLVEFQYSVNSSSRSVVVPNISATTLINVIHGFVTRAAVSSSYKALVTVLCQVKNQSFNTDEISRKGGWLPIFCYPIGDNSAKSIKQHLPSITSLIMNNEIELHHYKKRNNTSYFVTSISEFHKLVVIINEKRSESDKLVIEFMSSFVSSLKHKHVFTR